jgi:hypothetical protein
MLAGVGVIGATQSLSGQVLVGVVIDDATGEGVGGTAVELLGSAGNVNNTVLTDSAGAFLVEAEVTGRYTIRTRRLGYAEYTSDAIDLVRGDTVSVELRMGVEAIPLGALTARVDRDLLILDPRLERLGFYERRDLYEDKMGFAVFLEPEDIRDRHPFRTTDLFQAMRRIRLDYLGGRRVEVRDLSGRPVTYCVDGTPLRPRRGESIDDYVHPASIAAVEVYMGDIGPAHLSCRIAIWTGYAEGKYD